MIAKVKCEICLSKQHFGPSGETRTRGILVPNSVYAKTKEECEEKLMAMIAKVKCEICLSKQHT